LTSIARTRHRGDHSIRQIRDIRGLSDSTTQRCNDLRFSIFPRNLSPDFLQYMGERPQMTFHDGKLKKAKTTKGKNKTQVIFTCLESTHESKQRKQIDK